MKKTVLISGVAITALIGTLAVASPMGGKDRMQGQMGPRFDFDQVDTDKDGKITRAEMEAAAKARFDAADSDGDGALSAEEMAAAAQKQAGERAAQRHARMLERHDANGDGKLGFDEMGGNRMAKMFDRIDADSDGAVTKDELAEMRGKMGRHGKGDGEGHGWGHKHKRGQADE